jgi:hypothetical protein
VADWSFLTNHARALLPIAKQPDARLKDLAAALAVTERTAYGIVADLSQAAPSSRNDTGPETATTSKTAFPCATPSAENAQSAKS